MHAIIFRICGNERQTGLQIVKKLAMLLLAVPSRPSNGKIKKLLM